MEIMKRGMRATMIVLMIAAIVIVSCGRQVHHKAVVTDVRVLISDNFDYVKTQLQEGVSAEIKNS